MSECGLLYQNAVQLEYRNNGSNESIKDGEELAQKQFDEAYVKMQTEFTSNPQYQGIIPKAPQDSDSFFEV